MQVTNNGASIFYSTLGAGPDVVLLHAFPSCHELWLPVSDQLSQRYRVTLLDLRAHGQSGVGEGPAEMSDHASDLARVCRELGIAKAVFAGVSIGGYVLCEFWRTFREHVRALALCDTRATADTSDGRAARLKSAEDVQQRGVAPFIESMLPKLIGETTRRNRPDVVEAARKTMRYSTPAGIAAAQRGMAQRPDSTATLSTIDVPVLVLCGEEDTLTPLSDSQAMQSAIKGSQLQVIPQSGHYAVFEKPAECGRILRKFLDGL
jgi:3-oxoadipate enol-lactonase